jgi:hypothetical protein
VIRIAQIKMTLGTTVKNVEGGRPCPRPTVRRSYEWI